MINLTAALSVDPRPKIQADKGPAPVAGGSPVIAFTDMIRALVSLDMGAPSGSKGQAASGNELPVGAGSELPDAVPALLASEPVVAGPIPFFVPPERPGEPAAPIGDGPRSAPAFLPISIPLQAGVRPGAETIPATENSEQPGAKEAPPAPAGAARQDRPTQPTQSATATLPGTAAPSEAAHGQSASAMVAQVPAGVALMPVADILRAKSQGEAAARGAQDSPASKEQTSAIEGGDTKIARQVPDLAGAAPASRFVAQAIDAPAAQPAPLHGATSMQTPSTLSATFSPPAPPQAEAIDLNSVIDRLVEARQSAGSGRVHLSVSHSDFGAVGVRLEQTAGAGLLGVALTSGDPGFAPAVQAALAERAQSDRQPQTGGDAASRQDGSPTKGDSGSQGQSQANQSHLAHDQARSGTARSANQTSSGPATGDSEETDTDANRPETRGRYA